MIMIPLHFVLAAITALILHHQYNHPSPRDYWWLCFLALSALQITLIGSRFGYSIDWIRQIQPFTAALLPPLAYLSFKRPPFNLKAIVHLIPFLIIIAARIINSNAEDLLLSINNLIYAIALIFLGLAGSDTLGWTAFERSHNVMRFLWLVTTFLLVSFFIDALISYDSNTQQGNNVKTIVNTISIISLITTLLIALYFKVIYKKHDSSATQQTNKKNQIIFAQLEQLMHEKKFYIDPDINLNRIARKLGIPANEVSRAINQQSRQNVSQYVNKLRVNHACQLLRESKKQITEIIYASGFNTKSNFNREFRRITGETPSIWRTNNIFKH